MDPIDELYSAAWTEFVSTRNDLAKRVRAAGNRDSAAEIRRLSKPTRGSWLLNQLARRAPDAMSYALETLDAVYEAQLAGLGGDGADTLRAASAEERAALAALREEATSVLRGSRVGGGKAVLDRAVRTLKAAARDPDLRANLEQGKLTEDHDETGFDAFAAGAAEMSLRTDAVAMLRAPKTRQSRRLQKNDAPEPAPEPRSEPDTPSKRAIAAAKRSARKAATEAKRAERSAEKTRMTANVAGGALEDAEVAVAEATAAVAEAKAALEDAKADVNAARVTALAAAADAKTAEATAARARRRAEEAKSAHDALAGS